MFSWDLLFYYTISFLFLTEVKNISASNVILIEAFFSVFKFILQIPCSILISKLGNRKSIIIGNVAISIYLLLLIFSKSYSIIILANLFWAIGSVIKNTCDTNILYSSIPHGDLRRKIFTNTDGKGNAYHYYFDAITALLTGFLYIINPYVPIIISLCCTLFAAYISFKFSETKQDSETEHIYNKSDSIFYMIQTQLKDLRSGFKYIFKSNRLRSLIIFSALLCGLLYILNSLRKSILIDINFPIAYYGIVFSILGIVSGITSKKQNWFNHRYKNKTLAVLSMCIILPCIVTGFIAVINVDNIFKIFVILTMFLIQYIVKGPFYGLSKRYLSSFANSDFRNKIFAAYNMVESIVITIVSLICSGLIAITNTAYSFIILGLMFTAIIVVLLDYMRGKVGLKPEEYDKKEISFTEVK